MAKVDSVLSIKGALIQYDDKTKKPYVEIEMAAQKFERKEIELGISDGINVEVRSGLSLNDKIKVWNKIESIENND